MSGNAKDLVARGNDKIAWYLGSSLVEQDDDYQRRIPNREYLNEAISLFEQAFQEGSIEACYQLGEIYRSYGERDPIRALEWYKRGWNLRQGSDSGSSPRMIQWCGDEILRIMCRKGVTHTTADGEYLSDIYRELKTHDDTYSFFKCSSHHITMEQLLFKHQLQLRERVTTLEQTNAQLLQEIELLKADSLYKPGSNGFLEAKREFETLCSS